MLVTADDKLIVKVNSTEQTTTKAPVMTKTSDKQQAKDAGVVQYLIGKKKTPERLLELLQLGDPAFKEADLQNPEVRQKAWRKVMILIHPDHNDESDATQLFQDSQNWYSSICRGVQEDSTRREIAEFATGVLDENYDFFGVYPHLRHWHPWRNTGGLWAEEFWAGVACINLRGAYAFGKCPEISFSLAQLLEFAQDIEPKTTAMTGDMHDIFKKFGGRKTLRGGEVELKQHLRAKGPVVSLSFKPSAAVIDQFPEIDVGLGSATPVLIVGWKTHVYGQSWTVYLPSTARTLDVAFGQCSISEHVVYPGKSMDKFSWEPGPYFPIDMSKWDADFRSWANFSIHLTKARNQEFLTHMGRGRIFEKCGVHHAVVLRDMKINAKTLKVQVSDFEYDPKEPISGRPFAIHLIPM